MSFPLTIWVSAEVKAIENDMKGQRPMVTKNMAGAIEFD